MKQHYIDILENAQRWLDNIDDVDKFLDDMLEYQKNAGGPTIDEFLNRNRGFESHMSLSELLEAAKETQVTEKQLQDLHERLSSSAEPEGVTREFLDRSYRL